MKLFFNLTPLSYHAINSCFIFLLVIFLSCNTSNCLIKLPENITIPALFAFGDSVFDTGNNNGIRTIVKANFPPYGRDFPGGKPTGRFSNGKIATDIIGIQYYLNFLFQFLISVFLHSILTQLHNLLYGVVRHFINPRVASLRPQETFVYLINNVI